MVAKGSKSKSEPGAAAQPSMGELEPGSGEGREPLQVRDGKCGRSVTYRG